MRGLVEAAQGELRVTALDGLRGGVDEQLGARLRRLRKQRRGVHEREHRDGGVDVAAGSEWRAHAMRAACAARPAADEAPGSKSMRNPLRPATASSRLTAWAG